MLVVSAHGPASGRTLVATHPRPDTIHHIGGFPGELQQMRHPAPGASEAARKAAGMATGLKVHKMELDHGAWKWGASGIGRQPPLGAVAEPARPTNGHDLPLLHMVGTAGAGDVPEGIHAGLGRDRISMRSLMPARGWAPAATFARSRP